MESRTTTRIVRGDSHSADAETARDLVMTWAIDRDTEEPRYILQLDSAHRGSKSNCKCPSCDLPLQAVNAAKTEFKNRPHFRHPAGAARDQCAVVSARKALRAMFREQDLIELPRRRRSSRIEGLSGKFFDAWVEQATETVRLRDCEMRDEATAILTLDDGRKLAVRLKGSSELVKLAGKDALLATIELDVDDPEIAMMSPEEIFSRLRLAWAQGCWRQHWDDDVLDSQADAKAREAADLALDWLVDVDFPAELLPSQRRETLLHREVKAILEREKRLQLPAVEVEAGWRRRDGSTDTRTWSSEVFMARPERVRLEVHLGFAVPDVVIEWVEHGIAHTLLVEVTVTNPFTADRVEKIASLGLPVLEIDIGRMGGTVTREELKRLVVDEVAGKRWLFHPAIARERDRLVAEMKTAEAQAIEVAARREELLEVPEDEWARRFLEGVRSRWDQEWKGEPGNDEHQEAEHQIQDAIEALVAHDFGAAAGLDQQPLRSIVARILSIKLGTGVEYKCAVVWPVINAIQNDGLRAMKWHTLYLMALRTYQPPMSAEHLAKVAQWRLDVVASINGGEATYIREDLYDRLLCLLFPEMQQAIMMFFGTVQLPKTVSRSSAERGIAVLMPKVDQRQVFLTGKALEEWKRKNPMWADAWEESPVGRGSSSR